MAGHRSNRRRRRRRTSGLNLLLAIDKPYGKVTRSVDNHVGNVLKDDGVGHVGTLDPAVTGVLVLAVGRATKLIPFFEDNRRKTYRARIAFGTQTDTDDAQGAPIRQTSLTDELRDEDWARKVLASYVGKQMQRPPNYSAIKVNGVRSYDRARAGEVFELPEREVEVFSATLIGIDTTEGIVWDCVFEVSGGTYIRALARDIGCATCGAAHLASLCRTAVGNVSLDDCVALERIEELGADGVREVALDPVRVLGLPTYHLSEEDMSFVQNGRPLGVRAGAQSLSGKRVALVRDGLMYGIWACEGDTLTCLANFPDGIDGVRP